MIPASSRARTRRRQGGAEMPTRRASSTLVIRPSASRFRNMRRSIRSSLIRRIRSPLLRFADHRKRLLPAQFYCAGFVWLALARRFPYTEKMVSLSAEPVIFEASGACPPIVWALHDGKAGMASQAVGLADATGFPYTE